MTEFQKFAVAALGGFLLCVSWLVCFKAGQRNPIPGPDLPVNVKTDTLIIRDTIREKEPVFLTKYVDRVELVPVTDTIRRTDTLYMAVEIERKTYQGDDYRAVVTGWRPELAEIAVFPKTVYLQTEVTQPAEPARRRTRAGFGFTAGPAVIWTPDGWKTGAGVAGGLSITF